MSLRPRPVGQWLQSPALERVGCLFMPRPANFGVPRNRPQPWWPRKSAVSRGSPSSSCTNRPRRVPKPVGDGVRHPMCDASPGAHVLRASNGEPLSLARAAVAGEQRRGGIEADGEVPLDLRAGVLGDHRGALGRRPCRARPRALIRSASRLGHDIDRFTEDLQTHRWQDRIGALIETADLSGVSARRASSSTASGSEACTTWPRSVAPFAAHIPAPPSCALPGSPGSGSADGSYGNVVVTTLGPVTIDGSVYGLGRHPGILAGPGRPRSPRRPPPGIPSSWQ